MTEGADGDQSTQLDLDPRYVEARRVLLDALYALAPQGRAIIVAGAQAVYLRTGFGDIAIAPYTTDGDLALDPSFLGDEPNLAAAMSGAGFQLLPAGKPEPGVWVATAIIDGQPFTIPIDLIVPEGVAAAGHRRSAPLGTHGDRTARRALGLEAVLVDHSPMTITALDPSDSRSIEVEVAGVAGLFVAKAYKIHDRLATGRTDRSDDKDAADVYRLMQETAPRDVGATLAELSRHAIAGLPTTTAIGYLNDLFGIRGADGIQMAVRALRLGEPEERVTAVCVSYVERVVAAARADGS